MLLIGGLLVLLNGFFVAVEFALVKVRTTKIRELAEAGSFRAKVTSRILKNLTAYLSATQLGVTTASLGLGWVGEPAVEALLEPIFTPLGLQHRAVYTISYTIAFIAITFVHIVIGELTPKAMALRRAERISLWLAIPLRLFYLAAYPAIWLLNKSANLVLKLMGVQAAGEGETAHSEEELRMIVAASHAQGVLNTTERELLENVFELSERRVSEIMVPRIDMVCLYTTQSFADNLEIVHEHRHTRYPLVTDDKDHIVGIVHVKDMLDMALESQDRAPRIDTIKRPVLYVPENATIDMVLKTFQKKRTHIAIVVDEYGGVAGLVTLESVLEELVGPLRDEFDIEERPLDAGRILISGGRTLEEVAQVFGLPIAEDEAVNTVGGYVLKELGHAPHVGEGITVGPFRIEVVDVEGNRVTHVRIRKLPPPAKPPVEEPSEQAESP